MNIQEQTASEMKRTALDMGKTAAGAVRNTTEAAFNASMLLIKLLQTVSQDRKADVIYGETTLDKMKKLVADGDFLASVTVADEDIEFYKSAMQKEKMPYVVLDINNDDCKNIIYMNSDAKKLKNVISLHQARAGMVNEVAPEVFLRHIEDKNIGVIRNLSDTDFELFRKTAREKDLIFSFYRKNDRVSVLYNLKDKPSINDVLNTVSWDMTGKHEFLIRNGLFVQRLARQEFSNAVEGRGEFYAVNAKDSGNYLTVTDEGLSYYKNNNKVFEIPRTDKYFEDKAREKFKGLQSPVSLSKTEFETPSEERELIIQNRYNIFPDHIAEAVMKSREHLNNVISKMSLDDENENPAQIFDDSVSYSGYAEYEKLSDTDREELKEHIEKFSVHRRSFENKEIPVKDRKLDNIIREAERNKTVVNSKDERNNDIRHERDSEVREI